MTKIQKAYCSFFTMCLAAILLVLPDSFYLREDLYKPFFLYEIWEQEEKNSDHWCDMETLKEITDHNMDYAKEHAERSIDQKTKSDINSNEEQNRENTAVKNTDQSIGKDTVKNVDQCKDRNEKDTQPALSFSYLKANPVIDVSMEALMDPGYLLNQFFVVDENTTADAVDLNAAAFLQQDFKMKRNPEKPQILIYHSHSQETFVDSRPGKEEDTIVGVGTYLKNILEERYGYQVIHVKESFDLMSGQLDRSKAYDYAREKIEIILKKNPSVEVVIDLHRDGVPEGKHLVTKINGKDTARLLFFNGISYTNRQGVLSYLPNPYIQENLAFSFQLEYGCALYYPELYRGIYLAGLRYNLHLMPKALLLEAGAQTNTVEEVKNAMEPFACLLHMVLTGNLLCPE